MGVLYSLIRQAGLGCTNDSRFKWARSTMQNKKVCFCKKCAFEGDLVRMDCTDHFAHPSYMRCQVEQRNECEATQAVYLRNGNVT
jgi:hypothetical protein